MCLKTKITLLIHTCYDWCDTCKDEETIQQLQYLSAEMCWFSQSVGSLNPKSKTFLSPSCLSQILSHCSDLLPQGNIENEISNLKNYLSRNPMTEECQSLHHLLEHIDFSISDSERMFSDRHDTWNFDGNSRTYVLSPRRLKTSLRWTMAQQNLDELVILYIKRDLSCWLWNSISDLVLKFAQTHNNSKIA